MLWLENHYERLLAFFLRHRWLTPIIGLAVIASTWFPFSHIDKNFDANETELAGRRSVRATLEPITPLPVD